MTIKTHWLRVELTNPRPKLEAVTAHCRQRRCPKQSVMSVIMLHQTLFGRAMAERNASSNVFYFHDLPPVPSPPCVPRFICFTAENCFFSPPLPINTLGNRAESFKFSGVNRFQSRAVLGCRTRRRYHTQT